MLSDGFFGIIFRGCCCGVLIVLFSLFGVGKMIFFKCLFS